MEYHRHTIRSELCGKISRGNEKERKKERKKESQKIKKERKDDPTGWLN